MLCLFLFNCKQSENKIITTDSKENKKVVIEQNDKEFKAIFIGLSPKMTDEVFLNEIEKLNSNGKLENSKFVLYVNNETLYFEIQKLSNSIRLNYSDIQSKYIPNLSYEKSDKYLNEINIKKDNLIKIFQSKYKSNIIEIPTDLNLDKYGLEMEKYLLFRDTDKSVLLGYTVLGSRVPSPSEREEYYNKLVEENPDDPLAAVGRFVKSDIEYVDFGLEIEINYYHNEDLNSLLENLSTRQKLY